MKWLWSMLCAALVIGAVGVTSARVRKDEQAAPAAVSAGTETLLRVHGSNTIGEKLLPALAREFLNQQGYLLVQREQGAEPVEHRQVGRGGSHNTPLAIDIHAHGSGTAFVDLGKGSADIGMSSRRIKDDERDALKNTHGDLRAPGQEIILAFDALAIIVSPQHPLTQLSVPQLAAVFSGTIQDWSQLGYAAGPIHVYARDDKSGTWDTFESLVLKPAKTKLRAEAKRYESSEQLNDAVAADPLGIGFVGIAHVRNTRALAISVQEGSPAVEPQRHAIGAESYALSRRLYLYLPENATPLAREFVAFASGNAGQRIVEQQGQIAFFPTRDKPRLASQFWPRRYRSLGTLAERLSVRFPADENGLQQRAETRRDLDRIAAFFAQHPEKNLVIADLGPAGPSDSRGGNQLREQFMQALAVHAVPVHEWVRVPPNAADADSQRRLEIWAL